MRIGILGPEGTFSESAARYWLKRFRNEMNEESTEAEFRFYETISDVYEGLMRYEIDFGVVPIENSLEGSVSDTLDVLSSGCNEGEDAEERTKIQIVGEVLMPIRIFLLGKGYVRKVVSHPHALAQCKRFLRSLRKKGVEVKAVESTALAAKIASLAPAEEGVAALASEEASRKYKLRVLARDVQDRESVTRFVVLAREYETKPTGHDKTSILIYLKDRPGALYEVLGEFAHRKINLTKIESRPSKKALGDYMFHIDCEGHISEKLVKEAIEGVRKKVTMLKILGSYPRDSLKGR